MDHHCPWVGNCVGIGNHRQFIQFVWYAGLDLLLVGTGCFWMIMEGYEYGYYLVFCTLTGFGMGFVLMGLGCFHFWVIISNRTTVELKSIQADNYFDTGDWKENLKQVFGDSYLGYFLPIRKSGGLDGVLFPVRNRDEVETIDEV